MKTETLNQSSRRLPSIDWIALGVGVIGLALSRVHGPLWSSWAGLLGLAVFGPPLLRELGILKDEDEYTRSIRWRAGFHALLVVAALVFLNRALYPLIASHPDAMVRKVYFFPDHYLRQSLVMIFLISYLIQYWGAPKGVFRLILGLACVSLIDMGSILPYHDSDRLNIVLYILGLVVLMVGVAFLMRSKPKLGGYLLLLTGMIFTVFVVYSTGEIVQTQGLEMQLGLGQTVVTLLLFFVPTGFSLIKASGEEAV